MRDHRRFVAPSTGVKTLRDFLNLPQEILGHTAFLNSTEKIYPKLTYGEVKHIVESLGDALFSLGVEKGDRVGIMSENRSEWALAYFAVTTMGAIAVPIDIQLTAEEVKNLLADSASSLLFISALQKPKVESIRADLPQLKTCVVFDPVEETLEGVEKKEAQALISKLLSMKFIPAWVKALFRQHQEELSFSKGTEILLKDRDYLDFRTLVETGASLGKNGGSEYARVKIEPDDTAVIIYTSGTTGNPKGVMLSHQNLADDADKIQQIDRMTPHDRWVTLLPLHHTFPAMAGLLVPFLSHGSIKFLATLRTDVLTKTFREMKVTSIPIVPLFLEKVYKGILKQAAEKGNLTLFFFQIFMIFSRFCNRMFHFNPGKILFRGVREKLGLSHLKYFICGGGPIAREILKRLNIMGIFVTQGYGLSETSPTVTCNNLKVNRFGSVGYALDGVELKIADPDKKGNGEIWIKAPMVMKGYYHAEEKTREVIDADGFFHTGDIGRLDRDGFLWITGRLKNIIVTAGGKNVYPEELENLLLQSELIAEVVVIGSRDFESNSEQPYAMIYPDFEAIGKIENTRGKKFTEDDLYDFMNNEIKRVTQDVAPYKKITGFELLYEELPKTSSKKVKRFLFQKK